MRRNLPRVWATLALMCLTPLALAGPSQDDAWLLVAVDSAARLQAARFERVKGSGRVTVPLPRGTDLQPTMVLVPIRSGTYRLVYLEFQGGQRWKSKTELRFEMTAGRINYPGDIGLEAGPDGLSFRSRDSSGRARTWLSDHHAETVRSAAVKYVGPEADGWTAQMEGR